MAERTGAGRAGRVTLPRRVVFGLRGRIVAALMLTAAATLGVAALALLSPLERRLRNAELSTLVTKTRDARDGFSTLRGRQLAIDSPALQLLGRDLVQSTGAQEVYVLDATHTIRLRTTDQDTAAADPFDDVARALATHMAVRTVGRMDGDEVVRVAVPFRADGTWFAIAARKQVSEVRDAVAVVRRAFTTAALAGLAIALVLGLAFAARIVRRLRRLRDATVRLAERGPAEEVPADRNADEVGDLTRSFARMQHRLLQQEEARRSFVATASHELRTPVASLRGMLELLDDDLTRGHVDLADARTQVGRALIQARRLGRLASDLLDLSRLDAEVAMREEPIELGELARAVIAEFELAAGPEGSGPVLDDPSAPVWVQADPGAVAQILRILLDNAVRMSPRHVPVRVAIRVPDLPGERIALTVTDAGPGVPPAERERIFQRFARGSTADGAGFGLGLAIGRELAERMHGSLVLDELDEPGTAFTLRLPASAG